MNALGVLCAQLTRDLFAIAKFLLKMALPDGTFIKLCRFLQVDFNWEDQHENLHIIENFHVSQFLRQRQLTRMFTTQSSVSPVRCT